MRPRRSRFNNGAQLRHRVARGQTQQAASLQWRRCLQRFPPTVVTLAPTSTARQLADARKYKSLPAHPHTFRSMQLLVFGVTARRDLRLGFQPFCRLLWYDTLKLRT